MVTDTKYLKYILSNIDENNIIKQEYINGVEYTVDAYVSKKGKFMGAVPRIRSDVTSGESTTATVISDQEIIKETKNILSKFKFKGPLTLQFIREDEELYFLEAYGNDRSLFLFYNEFDSCCFSGKLYNKFPFADSIKTKLSEFGKTNFDVIIDHGQTEHIISDYTLKKITTQIKNNS